MFCFVFLAPYARTTRYEEAFLPEGKKRSRSLRSLGLASILYTRVPGNMPGNHVTSKYVVTKVIGWIIQVLQYVDINYYFEVLASLPRPCLIIIYPSTW